MKLAVIFLFFGLAGIVHEAKDPGPKVNPITIEAAPMPAGGMEVQPGFSTPAQLGPDPAPFAPVPKGECAQSPWQAYGCLATWTII